MFKKLSAALLRLGPRPGFWLLCLLAYVAIAGVVRIGLAAWVAATTETTALDLGRALLAGAVADTAMAVALGLPFLLGLVLLRRPLRWWPGRLAAHLMLAALSVGLVFGAVAEFFFWNEFSSRFNGIAVNYLIFPREVIGNIRESFDLRLVLPPVAAVGLALYLVLRVPLARALAAPAPAHEWRRMLALALVAALAAAPVLWAGLPAWSANREINEVQRNGLHELFRAFLTNDAEYAGLYPTIAEDRLAPLMRRAVAQPGQRFLGADGLLRRVDNGPAPTKRLNVVLVIEESFGSTYVDSLDNRRGFSISPSIERLAQDGLFFTNVYATGDRTVRGLEALLTSFTPIPGISTARRPGSVGMHSLPSLLKRFGYRSGFLYGGIAAFDNMGAFWSGIGFDHVWDLFDIADRGFTTVWGAADEYLFTEALKRLDEHARPDQPFFLGLLTVSNHRPYTFPEDHVKNVPGKGRRENAATYADWAFGDFIERARSHPWFDDTVFIFVGDHGPRITGAEEVPVRGFRVPLLFYAPRHIPPARLDTLASSLDVAPTLLGLLGLSYDSPFFGLDLRKVAPGDGRIAMAHNYSVAYGRRGELVVLRPTGDVAAYRLDDMTRLATPDATLIDEAVAVTQGAHKMFYDRRYHEKAGGAGATAARPAS